MWKRGDLVFDKDRSGKGIGEVNDVDKDGAVSVDWVPLGSCSVYTSSAAEKALKRATSGAFGSCVSKQDLEALVAK